MALHPVNPALVKPLRGQQQVHAEAAAHSANRDEQLDELRLARQQLGELVDDDKQRRQRRQRRPGKPGFLVIEQRREAGLPQQLLAADDLAIEGVLHPVYQQQLVGQVGDHSGGMRQPVHVQEGRPALEVDQDEVEDLRGMRGGQADHQGSQQLALARAGRPDEQAVRSHAALGRLLEIELHHLAVLGHPDRHLQAGTLRRPRPPFGRHVKAPRIPDAQQRGELEVGLQGLVGQFDGATGAHRCDDPGQVPGTGAAERVDQGTGRGIGGRVLDPAAGGGEAQHLRATGHDAGDIDQHGIAQARSQQRGISG